MKMYLYFFHMKVKVVLHSMCFNITFFLLVPHILYFIT